MSNLVYPIECSRPHLYFRLSLPEIFSMNLPGLQLNDLSTYHHRLDLIEATAEQINKDFMIGDEAVEFSGNPDSAYTELQTQIADIVFRLLQQNAQNLVNILYRIDLKESQIKEAFETELEEGTPGLLAHFIIERELKKVLIRNYFREQTA